MSYSICCSAEQSGAAGVGGGRESIYCTEERERGKSEGQEAVSSAPLLQHSGTGPAGDAQRLRSAFRGQKGAGLGQGSLEYTPHPSSPSPPSPGGLLEHRLVL